MRQQKRRVDLVAEGEILYEILREPGVNLPHAREHLAPADFYEPAHSRIFEAFCALADERVLIDAVTLCDKLRAEGVLNAIGGPSRIGELQSRMLEFWEIRPFEEYVSIVAKHARARRIGHAARDILTWAADESVDAQDLSERAQKVLSEASQERAVSVCVSTNDVAYELCKEFEALARGERPRVVWTGLDEVDSSLGGLHQGHLVILGARPSVGKTALVGQIALLAATAGEPVLFFSLEMPRREVLLRLAVARAELNAQEIRMQIEPRQLADLTQALGELSRLPLYWVDDGRMTAQRITQMARAQAMRTGLGLIVVDYLQLVRAPEGFKDGRERVVAEAVQELKSLAKELNVPVLALAQINREAMGKEDERPRMHHLRESGAIEAAADDIMLLWRDLSQKGDPTRAELIIDKNRHGPTNTIHLRFVPCATRFESAHADNVTPMRRGA